jgi:hypothetical protein
MYVNNDKNDCPRGFIKTKSGCVPEGTDVADKLVVKYERYFFKEGKKMECKPGFRWCPITKKCLPDDGVKGQGRRQARGGGQGPMGRPMKEASDLVDIAFDEGFEVFGKAIKAKKEAERILDAIEECGMMGHGPLNKGMSDGEIEMDSDEYGFEAEKDQEPSKEDNLTKKTNDINHVPNQQGKALYQSIRRQMSEYKTMSEGDKSKYKEFFDGMLRKFGVTSPSQLDDEKKKEFFNAIDKQWKAKNEND